MKGQWPPQCLPPIMWSEGASPLSIERAGGLGCEIAPCRLAQVEKATLIALRRPVS